MMLECFLITSYLSADLGMDLVIMFDVIVGNIEISTFFYFFFLSFYIKRFIFFSQLPFHVFELKCILNLLLRASMCVSECVSIRMCPWIYVLLCTCVYDCVCERASLSLPTFMSTGNYLRICLWHYVRELMFANVCGCEQACLWTSMSANVCVSSIVHVSERTHICERVWVRL